MALQVEPEKLRAAHRRLVDLAADTTAADGYRTTYLDITGSDNGHLFVHVDDACTSVSTKVADMLGRLQRCLRGSGVELRNAAAYYEETDQASAAAADRQIARVEQEPGYRPYDGSQPFEDTVPVDPGDYEPEDQPPLSDDEGVIMAPGPLGPGGHDGGQEYTTA